MPNHVSTQTMLLVLKKHVVPFNHQAMEQLRQMPITKHDHLHMHHVAGTYRYLIGRTDKKTYTLILNSTGVRGRILIGQFQLTDFRPFKL